MKVVQKNYAVEVKFSAEELCELEDALSKGCPGLICVKWRNNVQELMKMVEK